MAKGRAGELTTQHQYVDYALFSRFKPPLSLLEYQERHSSEGESAQSQTSTARRLEAETSEVGQVSA